MDNNLSDLNFCRKYAFAEGFKKYLDSQLRSENSKANVWGAVRTFYRSTDSPVISFDKDAFDNNPYQYQRKIEDKFIPDEITRQMDIIFSNGEILLHQRLVYWILRLIPSRISEVCAISIDCLKQFNGKYVLFIPTWKQNGGHFTGEIRSIHLEYTGMGKYLIDLITQQQTVARELQKYLDVEQQGLLLTHLVTWKNNRGTAAKYTLKKGNIFVVSPTRAGYFFRKLCSEYNLRDTNGKNYVITSHQFRHNGITERLDFGFTTEQIAFMTAHKGESMILNSYNHIDLKPETIIEKQSAVNNEPVKRISALFEGRILNMDIDIEKRLSANLRAHKVRGGICSDITNCSSDMMACLSCNFFVPELEQLPYFLEQEQLWKEKALRFKDFPIIVQNAEANAALNKAVVEKIKSLLSEVHDENNI
jgi:integrase